MPLSSHARLGPYEIVSAIGAGGMGEVYKCSGYPPRPYRRHQGSARKPLRLHRCASDFEREAKAISSLNRPHICTLHDVGRQDEIDIW